MPVLAENEINEVLTVGHQANECTSLNELQSATLEQLEKIFQADACVYTLSHGLYGSAHLDRTMTRGLPDDFHTLYTSQYYRFDPFAKWFMENSNVSPPVTTGEQMVSYRNYTRTKFYEEFFGRFSIHYILGIPLVCRRKAIGFIGLYRSRDAKHYCRRDLTKAELIAPHLAALTENTINREQLENQNDIIAALSNAHSINGVMVLDEDLKIIYMSGRAHHTISVLFKKESRSDHIYDWCPDSL